MTIRIIMAATAATAFLAGFATAQDTPAPAPTAATVVATVDGTEITLGEMIIQRAKLPPQYQQLPAEVLFSGILDQLIQQQVLADTMSSEPDRVAMALRNERRSLLAGEAITALGEQALTEEAVQAAYAAAFAGAEPTTEYNASHILLDTQEEAAEVKALIEGGADFADTARERSGDPAGANGGELGWFGPGMMVEPFETAVAAMSPGDVSDPVETQFGWHIVKLNETRIQEAPPLEEIRPQIEAQVQQQAIENRLAELTEAADVTRPAEGAFDPALLTDLDLLAD